MAVRPQPKTQSSSGWEERAMANAHGGIGKKAAAKADGNFQKKCAEAGVKPTGRQYAKWRAGRGALWSFFINQGS